MAAYRSAWLCLALLGCSAPSPGASDTLPANAFLAQGEAIPQLFRQCSRAAPDYVPTAYPPTAGDVIDLERKLPAALEKFQEGRSDRGAPATFDPDRYVRHYAAYTADGRAMIYGNFGPRYEGEPAPGSDDLRLVCDGGPDFFGVEYDVERREIVAISFNGIA